MPDTFSQAQRLYDSQSPSDQPRASGKAIVELTIAVEVEVDNGRIIDIVSVDDEPASAYLDVWLTRNYKRELVNGAEAEIEKERAL